MVVYPFRQVEAYSEACLDLTECLRYAFSSMLCCPDLAFELTLTDGVFNPFIDSRKWGDCRSLLWLSLCIEVSKCSCSMNLASISFYSSSHSFYSSSGSCCSRISMNGWSCRQSISRNLSRFMDIFILMVSRSSFRLSTPMNSPCCSTTGNYNAIYRYNNI